ncbi:hypothetical protein FHT37_002545 [Mitsuaria sp. BK037]|nr:hypothetical protein [Mitsuaria sp. BK037]
MVLPNAPLEDADLAPMSGAGGHPMAVSWKDEADGVEDDVTGPAEERAEPVSPLTPPYDVVSYTGEVSVAGYERLSTLVETGKTHDDVLLVLETAGGDPDAAFRIARALSHHYRQMHVLIPRYCKSAGTLIALGASALYMDDRSELGPLDVQVFRGDELGVTSSSLEQLTAANILLAQFMTAFQVSLLDLSERGLSTRVASEIAADIAAKLLRPMAEQVNPQRLAEMHRAMTIAHAYGRRLAERGRNVEPGGLAELVAGYPSHSFVIDRKEARRLLRNVWPVDEGLRAIVDRCRTRPLDDHDGGPVVSVHGFPFAFEGCIHV